MRARAAAFVHAPADGDMIFVGVLHRQVSGNVRLNQPFQLGQIDFRVILPEREHEAVMHVVVHAAVHQLR